MRGVRIQAIVRELNDEKIDVIEWNPDPAAYIAKALSPARVTGVYLNEQSRGTKTATVVVPEDQLSLAIGRDGQNARLAAKLTAWRIDIKSLPEAAADSLYKLQNDPVYASLAENEAGNFAQIESILAKKSEGRPVTPEEYSALSQFVDRVERGIISQYQVERKVERDRRDEILATIPQQAFELQLDELNLTDRINRVLYDAGYNTIGDLLLQLKLDSDAILGLNGIGPKSMEDIQAAIETLVLLEAEIPVEQAPEEVAAEVPVALEGETAVPVMIEEEVPQLAEIQAVSEVSEIEQPEQVEFVEGTEAPVEAIEEISLEKPIQEPEAAEVEEETPVSLDEIFALKPEIFDVEFSETSFEDEEEEGSDKKKKKKKKKFVEMEYDPDRDAMIVKRKRKRGEEDWEGDWKI
jgi:N utilization substance protein A